MAEDRKQGTCIECGAAVVRIRSGEERTTLHLDPDGHREMRCILNPAALAGLRVLRS